MVRVRLHHLTVLVAALAAIGAQAAASIDPPQPWSTLQGDDPKAIYDHSRLLESLASSQTGIKQAIQGNLFGIATGVPARLSEEPGVSLLAGAVEAYFYTYPGVYFGTLVSDKANSNRYNRWYFDQQINTTSNSTLGNGVTVYGQAYVDLRQGPLVLEVPAAAESAYWSICIYDAYLEEPAVLGTRNTGNTGGRWLLVPPGFKDPAQGFTADQVVESTTPQAFLLGRITKTTPNHQAFAKGFRITALDGSDPVTPHDFGWSHADPELALQVVDSPDPLYFWRAAGEALTINPRPGIQKPLKSQLQALGFSASGFSTEVLDEVALSALKYAPAIAAQLQEARYLHLGTKARHFWAQRTNVEQSGTDYALQAAVAKGFPAPNRVEDASYNWQFLDSTGRPLHGSKTYRISFDQAPPHDSRAFWSLQVLNGERLTYPGAGAIAGYGGGYWGNKVVTSTDLASVREDGSFDIILSPEEPADLAEGENWLPTLPNTYHLVLRVYFPGKEIVEDRYIYPPVEPVDPAHFTARALNRVLAKLAPAFAIGRF